jgi:formamidopyrimidine-DNA glycosylase
MPELPEVHTITSDLNEHIRGHKITRVIVAPNYKIAPSAEIFIANLKDKTITAVRRVAKNIIIELDSDELVTIHLAMTGRILIRDPKNKSDKWVKVILELVKDDDRKHLRFTDMRMFGKVALLKKADIEKLTAKYGPEVLDEDLTPEMFLKALNARKTNIKNALLDQEIVSGLGNIYATDALFLAKLHPETLTTELNLEDAEKLLAAAREVLTEGINNRGSTLPDKMYVDIFGKEGHQQEHFKIYMKTICPVCGSKVDYIKLNGRGTYYCPVCQAKSEPQAKQKKLI